MVQSIARNSSLLILWFISLAGTFNVIKSEQRAITLRVNEQPYTIRFESTTATVLGLAETFCRDRASDLGITTLETLLVMCVSPISTAVQQQMSQILDSSLIRRGELSEESRNFIAQTRATEAAVAATVAQPAPTASSLPTNYEVFFAFP